MEYVHGLFPTGSLIFWGLVLFEIAILIRCSADSYGVASYDDPFRSGHGLKAAFSMIVFAGILFIFGDWTFSATFSAIREYSNWLLWGVAVYFVIGIPWSVFQAFYAATKRGEPYRTAKANWLHSKNVESDDSVPTALLGEWRDFVKADKKLLEISQTPTFSKQKARIVRTLAFWPTSMLYFFLSDMFVSLFKVVVMKLKSVYQRTINYAYKDIRADFKDFE